MAPPARSSSSRPRDLFTDLEAAECSEEERRAETVEAQAAVPTPEEKLGAIPHEPPESLAGQTVYVIDANSLIFQVFHAIPEMTSPQGEMVNAVFGFTRDILFLLEKKKPTYLFAAFDTAAPTFRHTLYDDYKGTRSEMPSELSPQFPKIRRMLSAMGVPLLELDGYEADDILATVARITSERGGECYLVTADKDCRQLLSDRVRIYNVRKDIVYDVEALANDWGIRPDQVVDFQSMVGDSVDNIPGIPLIGPKIARELLTRYGTLEAVFEHVDEIAGAKRKQNIIEGKEKALLSRDLVRLDQCVPIEIDWDEGRVGGIHVDRALDLFKEFGFHRFAEQVRAMPEAQGPKAWVANYQTIDTLDALAEFLPRLREQKLIAIDTETTSVSPTQAALVGFAFAWAPGEAYYLPVQGPPGSLHLDPVPTAAALKPILEDPSVKKIGQNIKYDLLVLRGAGIHLAGLHFDTMIASYLLDAGERNHSLDELAQRYLDHKMMKLTDLIGSGRSQKPVESVPVADMAYYSGEDADVTLRLYPILKEKLAANQLEELYNSLELPLIEVLAELEWNGIRIDVERLAELSRQYGERLATIEREIYELAGKEFNIASPKQLQQILFEDLKLPVLKKTKTGPSTDVEVLEELAALHELPKKIIESRQYAKLKNTYVDALPQMVSPRTGRVHASFHQAVAATGRLSSSDPNLQNIPIRTETSREIRSAFLPGRDDWLLLAADYSQIELRVLAHFSGDETLCAAFASDEDIHALVASQVYGVSIDQVTPEMRRAAKGVNFGVIYGQSPFGLAKAIGIDQAEAAQFINAYFDRYPGVEQFMQRVLRECREKGYVTTILGRRRAISGVRDGSGRQRNLAERTAINTVIQGSAADLIKRAMIAIHRRLIEKKAAAKMLLQIHDELVFETPPEESDWLANLVIDEMTSGIRLDVPLKVDVKLGKNWAETEPWHG